MIMKVIYQRKNLRICTHSENVKNRKKSKNNTSGFKGVFKNGTNKRWRAKIRCNGKQINLGYFDTKLEAYEAYCAACEKYHKEFSNIK